MSDLDRYFDEFGAKLSPPAAARPRRAVLVAAAVAATAAVSVGVAIAADIIGAPTEVGPPTLGSYAPHAVSAKGIVATGVANGRPYSLRVFTDDQGDRCLELTQGGGVSGACGHPPTADHPIGTTLADQSPGGSERLLVGVADVGVASVDAHTATGDVAAATLRPGDGGDRAFVIRLPPTPRSEVVLTAKDTAGDRLGQMTLRRTTG